MKSLDRTVRRSRQSLRAGVRLQSTIFAQMVRIGTQRGTNRVGDLLAEGIIRQLATRLHCRTTRDVTKDNRRLRTGRRAIGTKGKALNFLTIIISTN
jgi:hypothetical protein